jgi:hypothetical protein
MMRLYSLYTPSHAVLKERFFVPSIPKDFDLRLYHFNNPGAGMIHDESFCRAIIRKVEIILKGIEENWNGIFAWCDVDTQFFGSCLEIMLKCVENHDIAFQIDGPGPALCDGLFVCRANEKTRWLWTETLKFVRTRESRGDDQLCVRELLAIPDRLRVGFLPPTFMGGGTFTGKLWRPGDPLLVPAGIVLHHANFTCGVRNKIAQCELVRQKIAARDFISYQDACERTGTPWLFV